MTGPFRICLVVLALGFTLSFSSARARHMSPLSRRMLDGKQWIVENLRIKVSPAYCYGDSDENCRRYGRLYSFESARIACRSLGRLWRLPTDKEWRKLAKVYGGVSEDSRDGGKAAYAALSFGGRSHFNGSLGGGRIDGEYSRLGAHGFYWTSSISGSDGAWFYNFSKGNQGLHRQSGGDKGMAISVRCVRD